MTRVRVSTGTSWGLRAARGERVPHQLGEFVAPAGAGAVPWRDASQAAFEVTDAEHLLRDVDLEDEISLVGELVVAATSHDRPLTLAEIDLALGLVPATPA